MSSLDELGLADLQMQGQLVQASNQTILCTARDREGQVARYVYKPVMGERPLWDFPDGTLAKREVAAYRLSELSTWQLVPHTWWLEDGPLGPGMLQTWIEHGDHQSWVDIFSTEPPDDWIHILRAEDSHGQEVTLAHRDTPTLQRLALFDAVLNNADRKAGHLLADSTSRLWAIDHGVAFHTEPKLRTVLWGWMGEEIPETLLSELQNLNSGWAAHGEDFEEFLAPEEVDAVTERLHALLTHEVFPEPSAQWPAVPWPVF
ncbi:MAG: hypothetical protein RJB01_1695 [Actinomycetota bacterium]|jgi:uncharacterized repeat protein (TIGR03843 family)